MTRGKLRIRISRSRVCTRVIGGCLSAFYMFARGVSVGLRSLYIFFCLICVCTRNFGIRLCGLNVPCGGVYLLGSLYDMLFRSELKRFCGCGMTRGELDMGFRDPCMYSCDSRMYPCVNYRRRRSSAILCSVEGAGAGDLRIDDRQFCSLYAEFVVSHRCPAHIIRKACRGEGEA